MSNKKRKWPGGVAQHEQHIKADATVNQETQQAKRKRKKSQHHNNEPKTDITLQIQNNHEPTPCDTTTTLHPFSVDPFDHCETPFEAYQDIEPFLSLLAHQLGVEKKCLRIYDPYYCEGSMIQHLGRLGFESVYNRNEDFYATIAEGRIPPYDVLVTNPPFSGEHMEKLLHFCIGSNKPWLLLLPQYVSRKGYYLSWRNNRLNTHNTHNAHNNTSISVPPVYYLGPKSKPYVFAAAGRQQPQPQQPQQPQQQQQPQPSSSDGVPVRAGKFQCVWFIQLDESIIEAYKEGKEGQARKESKQQDKGKEKQKEKQQEKGKEEREIVLAERVEDLPQLTIARRPSPAERRWRKKQKRLAQTQTK